MDLQDAEKLIFPGMLKNAPACADASAGSQMQQRAEGRMRGAVATSKE